MIEFDSLEGNQIDKRIYKNRAYAMLSNAPKKTPPGLYNAEFLSTGDDADIPRTPTTPFKRERENKKKLPTSNIRPRIPSTTQTLSQTLEAAPYIRHDTIGAQTLQALRLVLAILVVNEQERKDHNRRADPIQC